MTHENINYAFQQHRKHSDWWCILKVNEVVDNRIIEGVDWFAVQGIPTLFSIKYPEKNINFSYWHHNSNWEIDLYETEEELTTAHLGVLL